jgi:hypothetical protein
MWNEGPNGPETNIARTWKIEDAEKCSLCVECKATIGRRGQTALCMRRFYQHIPENEAPLFREPALATASERTDTRLKAMA